jgi:epoxyqueuosine reductase QueG
MEEFTPEMTLKNNEKNVLSEKIKHLADTLGIDVVGFAAASEFTNYALNHHQRQDPKLTLPNAKSIVIAGIYIGGLSLPAWEDAWYGRTSRLYLSGFFLDVVKPLVPIAELLKQAGYQTKICDGSLEGGSILPLKLAAIRAGLGWQGKHSLLISKKFGTFLALGGIITDAVLKQNTVEEPDRCRNCDKCQKACPLGALEHPYVLNVNKCMSYILQNDQLPDPIKTVMENRIGDCEICQESCPWNGKHLKSPLMTKMTQSFQKKIKNWEDFFYLPNLRKLSKTGYKNLLEHVNTDIPYSLFQRNVLIAMERAEKLAEGTNR